ncbi:MAG: acetyltransferase [Thermoflexibacter sp.]|jgi:sugar O-acyltransferase (sialic acid O-acetyltransferase NeuD family)|nr:acetyltransferase [Thermoflexibacter sp.]
MTKFAIIGGGALGEQFLNFIQAKYTNPEFVFFDDVLTEQKTQNVMPFNSYVEDKFTDYVFCIGLGYRHLRKKLEITEQLEQLQRQQITFVHPTCFQSSSAKIEAGTFVYPMSNIDKNVRIGRGTLINNSVVISHDSTIGDACYLSPSVVICGQVEIGECTFVGAGSIISNGIKIGKNVVIGIGSVVNKDVPDNCSAVGNPVKILNKRLILK